MRRTILLLLGAVFLFSASILFAQNQLPEPVPFTAVSQQAAFDTVDGNYHESSADPELLSLFYALDPSGPIETLSWYSIATLAQAAASDTGGWGDSGQTIPAGLANNQYYLESLRYKKLADESFDYGDYDAAAGYAAEAMRYAQLSDEYIESQLAKAAAEALAMQKARAAQEAIDAAAERMRWAASIGADKTYPEEYSRADTAFNTALSAFDAKDYDAAIDAARRVLTELAAVQDLAPLPAQYTVRTWAEHRDCFWNISGYPFVYNDPTKWRILYQANKSKLRQPENPDLIHPGIILDIPSINGEQRSGMWTQGRSYVPLPRK